MLRQTVVLQRRTAKLFNDASKALHKRIHIFRLCLIHPHCVRCDFMAPIRAFTPCRAQGPCVHKSFKTVSQLLENPYLYFCLANAGSPSQFACYPKAVRTGAPPKIKHRTPPPCVRLGSPPGLNLFLQPARSSGLFCCSRSARETALGFRAQPWPAFARRVRHHATPCLAPPSSLARIPLLAPRRHATPPTHFHCFPLVFAPHATSHPKSL